MPSKRLDNIYLMNNKGFKMFYFDSSIFQNPETKINDNKSPVTHCGGKGNPVTKACPPQVRGWDTP